MHKWPAHIKVSRAAFFKEKTVGPLQDFEFFAGHIVGLHATVDFRAQQRALAGDEVLDNGERAPVFQERERVNIDELLRIEAGQKQRTVTARQVCEPAQEIP